MRTIFTDSRSLHRRRNLRMRPGSLLPAVFFIILIGAALIWRGQIASILWDTLASLRSPSTSQENAGIATVLSSKTELVAENEQLKTILRNMEAQLADRSALARENLMLKSQFGRTDRREGILAAVIARPPALPYDMVMIDIGEDHNIRAGDLVSAGGGAYVGTVRDVYVSTSRIELFSSPGQTFEGMLGGTVALTVRGEGGGALTAQVPSGTAVSIGDSILMPGIALTMSAQVSGIEAPKGDSFKTLHLHLPMPVSSLRFVEVVPQTL